MKVLNAKYPEQKVEAINQNFNLYELIEAVNDAIEPGEESMVPLVVSHILSSCNATLGKP